MTLEFTPEQEAKLIEAANLSGKSVQQVVKDVLLWIVEMEKRRESECTEN